MRIQNSVKHKKELFAKIVNTVDVRLGSEYASE